MTRSRSEHAAHLALGAAYDECRAVNIDPAIHLDLLSNFVTTSVRQAVREMAVDLKTADPKFAFQLTTAVVQNIYFSDAGCRAAHSLLKHLGVPHARLTTDQKG